MDLDLRKYHINSEKELIEFLELVEARIPEIIRQVKKQSMSNASLRNVVEHERKKNNDLASRTPVVHAPGSTPEQVADVAVTNEEKERLEQMKAASENAAKVFGTQPKSGDIGQIPVGGNPDPDTEQEPTEVHGQSVSAGVDDQGGEQFNGDQPEDTEGMQNPPVVDTPEDRGAVDQGQQVDEGSEGNNPPVTEPENTDENKKSGGLKSLIRRK